MTSRWREKRGTGGAGECVWPGGLALPGKGSSSSQGAPASTHSSSVQRKGEGRVEEFGGGWQAKDGS